MKQLILYFLIVLPVIVKCQTFERIISGSNFQVPADLNEVNDGYLLLTNEGNADDDVKRAKIFKIDFSGNVVYEKTFNPLYFDKLSNIAIINDSTYLVTGYIIDSFDSVHHAFYLLNSKLETIKHTLYRSIIDSVALKSSPIRNSTILKTSNGVIYAAGYYSFTNDTTYGLELFKINDSLNTIQVNHYKQLEMPFYAYWWPEALLPYYNSDTTLLVFRGGKVYKLDSNCTIANSFPDDFATLRTDSGTYAVAGKTSAGWLDERLILSDAFTILSYKHDLSKKSIIRFGPYNIEYDLYAAYHTGMSMNERYAYLGYCFGLHYSLFYGYNNSLRIVKIDNELNIYWDKLYKENDDYFYSLFNTLATKDGGCLLAATRNNLDTQGEKLDIYLLKVDSLGNCQSINVLASNKPDICNVYPNPGEDYFTIGIDNRFCGSALFLYNSSGILIKEAELFSVQNNISTSNLKKGMYFYFIRKDNMLIGQGKWIKK